MLSNAIRKIFFFFPRSCSWMQKGDAQRNWNHTAKSYLYSQHTIIISTVFKLNAPIFTASIWLQKKGKKIAKKWIWNWRFKTVHLLQPTFLCSWTNVSFTAMVLLLPKLFFDECRLVFVFLFISIWSYELNWILSRVFIYANLVFKTEANKKVFWLFFFKLTTFI